MKRNKSILAVTVILILSLAFTACGKSGDTASTAPPTQQPEAQTPSADKEQTLKKLTEMLGKSDDEVKALYGGGAENKTEDSSVLLGRTYNTTINGRDAMLETVYSESSTVSSISISFNDMSFDDLKAMFAQEFGEPETVDNTAEMDSKFSTWKLGSAEITVNESYGMASAQITYIG